MLLKVTTLLETLPGVDGRRRVARELNRTFGGPLTTAERAARYRYRHEPVTESNDGVSRNGTQESDVSPLDSSLKQLANKAFVSKKIRSYEPLGLELLSEADRTFLLSCPAPFNPQWLNGEWWTSLKDGYPKVDLQMQASRYMAWEGAVRKRDHRASLRKWVAKADAWRENDLMRKAVRA